jgi:undecaprenyl-diphosphatase
MSHFSVPSAATAIIMAGLALAGSIVCIRFAPASIAVTQRSDPREVVADEFAGQALVFVFAAAFASGSVWAVSLCGFLLFRVFDIVKPWPIRMFEKLPRGWGILADDLVAGVCAAAVLIFLSLVGLLEWISTLCRFDSSSLNVLSAAVLGAIQGLTEFLPVSSSGHLVLFENLFRFDPEQPEMLLFDLAVHVGTVVAIICVFCRSIGAFFKNLMESGKYGNRTVDIYKRSPSVRLLVLGLVATVVTGVVGLLFKKYFAAARGSLLIVCLMWFVTGTLLLITDWRKRTRLGLRQFGLLAAVLIGLAQAAAIMPGISRSGATICTAILIGLRRRWAVEFSFLIAIPAILGAAAVQSIKDFAQISSGSLPIGSVIAGSVVAALTGIFALKLLIRTSRTAHLKYFAFYCYILACFVLTYLLIGL